jgi:lysozyme
MISEILKDLAKFEGLKLTPYKCTAGKLTIGYGRNLEDNGITPKEAEIMLFNDIDNIINKLNKEENWWLSQPYSVRRVIIQMCYQLGLGGFRSFKKFILCLQNNDLQNAVNEMYNSKWAIQTPERVKFLSSLITQNQNNKNQKRDWDNDIRSMGSINDILDSLSIFS